MEICFKDRVREYSGIFKNLVLSNLGKISLFGLMIFLAYLLSDYIVIMMLVFSIVLVSTLVSKFGVNRLGIELSTFSTVTMGFAHGPETGALLGLIFISAQLFTGSPPGIYMVWVLPSFGAAGYTAGVLSGQDIVYIGIMISVALQSIFMFFTALMMRERVPVYMQYGLFNILFNAVLFMSIGSEMVLFLQSVS